MYISFVPSALMKYTFFHFTRWNKSHIHSKHLNIFYMFGSHRRHRVTHILKTTTRKQSKGLKGIWSQSARKPQTGQQCDRPQKNKIRLREPLCDSNEYLYLLQHLNITADRLTHCILNRLSNTIYWKSPISVLGTCGYEIYIFLEKNG